MKASKQVLISLGVSLVALGVGIWLFMYSSFGMGGLRAISPDAQLPDTIESPSIEVYRQVIGDLGEDGRAFYLSNIRFIDSVFPFLYVMPLFVLLVAATLRSISNPLMQKLIPVAAFIPSVFDLLENRYLHTLVHNFPTMDQSLVQKTLFFTTAKAITRDLLFYSVVLYWSVVGITFLIQHIRGKHRDNH
jgi:hypothetical protein